MKMINLSISTYRHSSIIFRKYVSTKAKKLHSVSRVRGTRDLVETDASTQQRVIQILGEITQRYGFKKIQTPLLEYTELFSRSLGDGSDIVMKEMYTFQDKSGKSLTLRPEGTAGVARALLSNELVYALPQKLYYNGSMFRYERPQRGRYREFQQFGVEFVGSKGFSVDVEVIAMAAHALQALGLQGKTVLEINTLGDPESRAEYRIALEKYFSRNKEELSLDSQNRLARGSVLRILDSKSELDQKFIQEAPLLDEYLSKDARNRFDQVLDGLEALNVSYQRNPRLVRGLDYYSHSVFEFVEKSLTNEANGIAVLAGGCYDGLFETLGGPSTSCIGWAAGIDRLCLLHEVPPSSATSIAVVPVLGSSKTSASDKILHKALEISQKLRTREDVIVHICHGKGNMKKQMKSADKLGCQFAVILGETEVEKEFVKVKNFQTRQEEKVTLNYLLSHPFTTSP